MANKTAKDKKIPDNYLKRDFTLFTKTKNVRPVFRVKKYPSQEIFKTTNRGLGLRLLEPVVKGTFINEYVGDVIDELEANRRLEEAILNDVTNFYMIKLDEGRIIDARYNGNYTRFINHSCSPNLTIERRTVNGDTRVGLFALRDIYYRQELTFNYNFYSFGHHFACRCDAGNCSGLIGGRPNVAADNIARNSACFRCGNADCDLRCSFEGCPRAFHRACAKGDVYQWRSWLCKFHSCGDCGRSAVAKCALCNYSYYGLHLERRMIRSICGDAYLCSMHKTKWAVGLKV